MTVTHMHLTKRCQTRIRTAGTSDAAACRGVCRPSVRSPASQQRPFTYAPDTLDEPQDESTAAQRKLE